MNTRNRLIWQAKKDFPNKFRACALFRLVCRDISTYILFLSCENILPYGQCRRKILWNLLQLPLGAKL